MIEETYQNDQLVPCELCGGVRSQLVKKEMMLVCTFCATTAFIEPE